jgi:hypothetical protein
MGKQDDARRHCAERSATYLSWLCMIEECEGTQAADDADARTRANFGLEDAAPRTNRGNVVSAWLDVWVP